jgi:hypothetical protein
MHIIRAGYLTVFCCFLAAQTVFSAEQLDSARVRQIAAMLPDQPAGFASPISDRDHWQQLATNAAFAKTIDNVSKLLKKPLLDVPDSLFLEFSTNGNRTHWQDAEFERRNRIAKFTLAEALENRGRFLPAIEQTIQVLCAEKTWVYPAHDGSLKNFHGEIITPELGATGLAAELAEADFVLGDKLSPATRQLIRDNIRRRVLTPFRDSVEGRRTPLHWLFLRMNWNAVCVGNTVFAALALEPSRDDRAVYAAAGEKYIRYFLSGFTPDGYCAEGVGYWNYGYGHFVLLTETLRRSTGGKIDLFNDDTAIAAGLFCKRAEILPGIFPTISDVSPGARPGAQLTAYVCRRIGLDPGKNSTIGDANTLSLTTMLSSLETNPPVVRQLHENPVDPLRSFFYGGGVLIERDPKSKPAFAACLKGGNNDEPHNHNDVASFSVVAGNQMVICDPGGEVYTRRTFGPHRYESQVLNSFGHAVPVIAGQLQRAGADARGVILATNFTAARDTYKLDYRSAYAVPTLEKLERTFTFQRGESPSLEVTDEVKFSQPESFETALITWGKIETVDSQTLRITDGQYAVLVKIDTRGRSFQIKSETIHEDVDTKRLPVRIGIALDNKISAGFVTLKITPDVKKPWWRW